MAVPAFNKFPDGFRLISGTKLNKLFQGNEQIPALNVSGFIIESPGDGIVANATGTQASGTLLTKEVNRIATSANAATPYSSVKLPPSQAGLTLYVINHGANPVGVFGSGTDTIDDVATATGVVQMQGSMTLYSCTTAGAWYSNGIGTGFAGSFPTVSYANGLTAKVGGGQSSGTPVGAVINRYTTVTSAADSATLPLAAGGMEITIVNAAAANSMNLFPNTGDTINALAANAAYAIAAGKTAALYAAGPGAWHAVLSA